MVSVLQQIFLAVQFVLRKSLRNIVGSAFGIVLKITLTEKQN